MFSRTPLLSLLALLIVLAGYSNQTDDPETSFRQCAELAQAGDLEGLMAQMTEKSLRNWTHNPEQQLERTKKRFPFEIHSLETRKQDAASAKLHWTGLIGDIDGEVSGYYDMVFEYGTWKCTGIGSWYRQTK